MSCYKCESGWCGDHDNGIARAYKAGFLAGAEQMRERAAKIVEGAHQGECPESMMIGALALEEEGEMK